MTQEEQNEEEEDQREENEEEVITLERKKTLRKLSSLDTTASSPSFYEPVNFSWEEQLEGNKEYGKTTEEILKMIEDEANDEEEEYEAPEDQMEDVIYLDSDEEYEAPE